MSDLIDRQAAIDAADRADYTGLAVEDVKKVTDEVVKELKQLPSAQPEVIRCKDCKYWDTSWQKDDAPNYHYCPMLDGIREGDFYCADAERRTDE